MDHARLSYGIYPNLMTDTFAVYGHRFNYKKAENTLVAQSHEPGTFLSCQMAITQPHLTVIG